MEYFNKQEIDILIVDDNPQNLQVLGKVLQEENYNLEFAVDGESALSWVKNKAFDLVLLDIMMPGIDGLEVCKRIRRQDKYKNVPVIFLSADSEKETILQGFEAGGQDYITKPFDNRELNMRVKTHITLKKSKEELENLNESLESKVQERTNQLEEEKKRVEKSDHLKTAFLRNISHEVRTPLNGILGFASIIIQPALSEEKKQHYLDILNKSGERLLKTITDYMDISLIVSENQQVKETEFSPHNLLKDIYEKYKDPCNKKGLALKYEPISGSTDITMCTDEELLKKIMTHLIDNAVKFTNKGSITFGYEDKVDNLEFFVIDTGIGITREAQPKIFDFFVQEDSSDSRGYEGSGLGLSIVQGFLNLLKGKIWLKSEKGKGTTFYFSIPLKKVEETTTGQKKSATMESSKDSDVNPVILIAEDDDVSYHYMNELLAKFSAQVIHAHNGCEAVDICKENSDITLVLMDMKMPVLDGYKATKEVRSLRKDLPVIAITAYAMDGDEEKVKDAGCDDYISKPVNQKELERVLKKYITGINLKHSG